MKRIQFTQTDLRWRSIPCHHEQSTETLEKLDEAIQTCLKQSSKRNRHRAEQAAHQFYQAVCVFINEGFRPGRRQKYSIEKYGCWICCLCMIAHDHNIHFYEYGKRKRKRLPPNPGSLIATLRSWQLLSPIGYTYDLIIDPITVVTRGALQLFWHRDYGEEGTSISLLRASLIALCRQPAFSVMVAVRGHPVFGYKDATHWVVLDSRGSDKEIQLMMRDPGRKSKARFSYRKVYVVCIYTTSSPKPPPLLPADE